MTPRMPAEEGLLQLPGDEPAWIWAFTCPTPGCDCREATVLWTGGDRATLLARGVPVAEAWRNRTGHAKAAAKLEGVTAFVIDIDTGGAFAIEDPDPYAELDLEAHPEARRAIEFAINAWNLHVMATALWGKPKFLDEARRVICGPASPPGLAAMFEALGERRRSMFADDYRRVGEWTLGPDGAGGHSLRCDATRAQRSPHKRLRRSPPRIPHRRRIRPVGKQNACCEYLLAFGNRPQTDRGGERAIQAGSRKRDPALFNSGLGERSPGPLRFSPTFSRPSTRREHDARVDSVRAESATGVKEGSSEAFWTAFALSLLASGERGTESA